MNNNFDAAEVKRQAIFDTEMRKELANNYMMLDMDDKFQVWYNQAILSLKFASPMSLNIPLSDYINILDVSDGGVRLDFVAAFCNNLEKRTPNDLGLSTSAFIEVMQLNIYVAEYWRNAIKPIDDLVRNRVRLMTATKRF